MAALTWVAYAAIEPDVRRRWVWVGLRVGLVAMVMTLLVPNVLGAMNVSFPYPEFLASTVLLGVVGVLAPGLFGFATSLSRQRSAVSWLD